MLSAQGPRSLLDFNDKLLYRITPSTALMFLAKAYRFVYVLDMSPSITAVVSNAADVHYLSITAV